MPTTIHITDQGNQSITGNKIFNSLRIEPSGRAFNIGTGLNINSESGIVRINTNVSSSLGAGFTYALTSGMDPNRPLDIEGRGRLVHGLSLDAGSANFTNASDHFHLFFSAGPNNPGSFNGRYSTDTNTNYKSYQFSPTTRPNGNDNLRDLIHLTTLEAKGANDQTFPTSNLTELYLTTTGTTVVTPPGTGLVELAYAINSQPTSQYLHSTGDLVYLRVFPGVAGIVANTYNGTVVTRATGLDPAYGSTNVYKVGIALGALNVNNNFLPAQRGTSTQTDAWTLTRSAPSNAFTGITRIERNSSQYLDQFNVFYASPITGYTGESVVVDVFNRGTGTFIASGITLTQARYDGYVSKVLSPTGLEITLSVMNFGSLGGVGRPGAFHNPPLTTGSAFISSEDLITGMKILRGSSDSVHRNYWAHNVFAGFRNLDANQLNVPAGVITRVAVGGLNRVESGSTSAIGFNNKAYALNSHAYGAHQENYNRDSVRIGATTESYINIVSGKLGVNVVSPSATIDIGTGNILAGGLLVNGTASLNDHLLFTSPCSGNITGYITGIGFTGNYTGNYEGGYFLGRTKLSQNTVQLIDSSFGSNFIRKNTTAISQTFRSLAISSDGRYQITAVGNYGSSFGYVYVSNDYGNTWTPRITDTTRSWRGVAISADGKYQTACHNNGYIYVSNDYGNTWTAKDSVRYWATVAMSSDGKYQTAAGGAYTLQNEQIYISSDYGNTWAAKNTASVYTSIAMSSDGKYQYALENVGGSGNIYKSSDYGNTWTILTGGFSTGYTSIATSADGRFIIVGRQNDTLLISNDYGASFVAKLISASYFSVAVSDNGKYMVAGIGAYFVSTGGIYFSSDYGNTWRLISPASAVWTVAISSNAKYVLGVNSANTTTPVHIFKTDELIDGNLTINNNLTLPSGDFYSYNATGVNSGEFGLIGWRNNQFVIGSQQSQSGILRDIRLTGANINLSASGAVIVDNRNPIGDNNFIVKAGNGTNGLAFNPTAQGGAGLFGTNWISTIGMMHQGDYDLELIYGGGGTRNITFKGGSTFVNRAILNSNGNFGIGSGISSVPSRFYVSGNSILQGNLTVSGNTTITGHLSAASKSFLIDHPTQIGKKLQYGSLESPYHGIRLTDKNKISAEVVKVYLPDYTSSLVNDEKVNIQLTNINHDKILFVKEVNINQNNFTVGMNRGWFDKNEYEFYWSFTAERKDIPKLTVEF